VSLHTLPRAIRAGQAPSPRDTGRWLLAVLGFCIAALMVSGTFAIIAAWVKGAVQ